MFHSGFERLGRVFLTVAAVGFVLATFCATPGMAFEGQNRLLSVDVAEGQDGTVVSLQSEEPIGYRYTIYDSSEPVRVIVDFPEMDVSSLESSIAVGATPINEIRVSSFELTSGELGRVEMLLSEIGDYDVDVEGTSFRIRFTQESSDFSASDNAPKDSAGQNSDSKESTDDLDPVQAITKSKEDQEREQDTLTVATKIDAVEIANGQTKLIADGEIEKFRYFELAGPPRLVVDIYDLDAEFSERFFDISQEFQKVRVGIYKDKVRFVFDAADGELPDFSVSQSHAGIEIYWGPDASKLEKLRPPVDAVPIVIESLDFSLENGDSVFSVIASGEPVVLDPLAEDDVVTFGVKNATINRDLRRIIDTSAFPSAVRLITPYPVLVKDSQDVRFAVELKGPVPYRLEREGEVVRFIVENGPFSEPVSAMEETVPVVVPSNMAEPKRTRPEMTGKKGAAEATGDKDLVPAPSSPVKVVSSEGKGHYTGEKITLIFDNADVRRIFQLIAEVSNLNIIVGDGVGGSITLRLVDVPWDQALDLILDIKDLGMIKEGNVVRVLPSSQIRDMRQAELIAVKEERELEPLITEVVTVSYTELGNVTGPATELLTDRGKITPDSRNKQLIVTDIPAVVEEVKKLVAILDTPEKQVMIEARIVEARTNLTRDLGITWAFSYIGDGVDSVEDINTVDIGGGGSFIINPSVGAGGLGTGLTFGALGVSSSVLDLRLSAAETAGQSKVISKPRVTTLNGEAATISQGTTIPYQSVSDTGTKTEFVDATLELDVTPLINPDDSIILEIKASNNTPTTVSGATAPGIDKKEASTKVLVQNGETTVLGGIFTESNATSQQGIPLLMRLPIIGHLFKSSNKDNNRSELLVFITPRILDR